MEEGADLIIGETFYYAGEALLALEEAMASGLPVVLTIALMASNEMQDGVGIVETCQSGSSKPAPTWSDSTVSAVPAQ